MKYMNGTNIQRVGLGCMGMSEFYGTTDDDLSLQTLSKAYEVGYRSFDTADMYGMGHNEMLLGKFLNKNMPERSNIFIASKVGIVRDPEEKFKLSFDNSRDYIRSACEASLKRLNTDFIDLYYLHRRDPDIPIEEVMGIMNELIKEGKIGSIGLCEVNDETLRQAHEVGPVAAIQSEYSLWQRDVEAEILPTCNELNIALVAFSPLGRGFLTGRINKEYMKNADPETDLRKILPRFSEENIDNNLLLFTQLEKFSMEKNLKPSQIALAWLLAKSPNVHIIPGTKTPKYLVENLSSNDITLTPSEITIIDNIFNKNSVYGERYPKSIAPQSNA